MSSLSTWVRPVAVLTLAALCWPSDASAIAPITTAQILANGATIVGYSYWWGHGRWDPAARSYPGKCTAKPGSTGCPSCSHSATAGGTEYGADCSGFVAKAWQAPSAIALTTEGHPFTASEWTSSNSYWKVIAKKDLRPGDALATSHHVVLFEAMNGAGRAMVYECSGCSRGCVHRVIDISAYTASRRNLTDSAPAGKAPTGKLEAVTCLEATGWAQDKDSPKTAVEVQITFGAPLGDAKAFVVKAVANVKRDDLTQSLGDPNHGFRAVVPARFMDGKPHLVYAYATDVKPGLIAPTKLIGSPQTITCAPTCTQLAAERKWYGISCDNGGTNKCKGQGVKTSDCQMCCGSTCSYDVDCANAGVCAWSGKNYCCRASGATGKTCFNDTECASGQVCAWNGKNFACTAGSCVDY